MPTRTVLLSATEEAYVTLVFEEHAAMVRVADQRKSDRMQVVFTDKGVPAGTQVNIRGASLSYEAPDIPASIEAPSAPAVAEASEKSTSA